jgi:hypothetical protein
MEAVCSSETLVSTYKFTWHYNPKDQNRHLHRRDNLKSHILCMFSCVYTLVQSGLPSNQEWSILIGPKGQKLLLALFLKTISQFSLSLAVLIHKRQMTIVYAQI